MVLEVGKQTMVKKAARNKMAVRNKNGRKRSEKFFRALCAMAIKVARLKKRRPGRKKKGQEKNGRKRAEKIFALYAPWYSR